MFNVFLVLNQKEQEESLKEIVTNIFDAMISSDRYKKLDDSEQVIKNWHIRDGIMDKIRDIYHIYNFSIQNANIIINKNKLDFSKIADGNFITSEYGIDSLQKLSLDYFLQTKKFVDKQFKIFKFLDILKADDKLVAKIKGFKPANYTMTSASKNYVVLWFALKTIIL